MTPPQEPGADGQAMPAPPRPRRVALAIHLLAYCLAVPVVTLAIAILEAVAWGLLAVVLPGRIQRPRLGVGTFAAVEGGAFLPAIVAVTAGFVAWLDRRPFRSLGFLAPTGWLRDAWLGLALGAGLQTALWVLYRASGSARVRWTGRPGPALAWGLLLFIPVALCEELTSRGYMLQTLRRGWGTTAAVCVSSLIFGLLHAANAGFSPSALAGTAAAGVMLACAYVRTNRLWAPLALHFVWNFWEGSVLGFPVSGEPLPGVLATTLRGPRWWTGGAFGPEASLPCIVLVLAAAVFLARVPGLAPASNPEAGA